MRDRREVMPTRSKSVRIAHASQKRGFSGRGRLRTGPGVGSSTAVAVKHRSHLLWFEDSLRAQIRSEECRGPSAQQTDSQANQPAALRMTADQIIERKVLELAVVSKAD